MSPKQKKIAAKAPPPDKIDAKDFAVLKAEKAKGRGMGLQEANGIKTITETDDEDLRESIVTHVAFMVTRLEDG